jgi:hypothetical protein
MPILQIVSGQPASGKSTVLAALAQGFARAGRRVRIERAGSGEAAIADAETFSDMLFAASSGRPIADVPAANANEVVLIELDGATQPLANVPALVAIRGEPTDADKALANALGERLVGTIGVGVEPENIEAVARDLTNSGLRPLALVPEDVTLSSPSVSEISNTLGATVLHAAESMNDVVEDVLIGPVYADPARPLFHRYAQKAILAPFNKTDLHLAAIESNAACLVITGGHDPSPYVVDRAHHGNTTLLLSAKDTPGTVASLSPVWTSSRFRGEAKANAAYALLEPRLDFAGLLKKLET